MNLRKPKLDNVVRRKFNKNSKRNSKLSSTPRTNSFLQPDEIIVPEVIQEGYEGLNDRQKHFCQEYMMNGYNGIRAYLASHPGCKETTAATQASIYIRNPKIKNYLDYLKQHIEELVGINRAKVAKEYMKIAFSSIADLHDTWITKKEFNQLTREQKASISEISSQIKVTRNADGSLTENEYIKVKLYDKKAALDSLSKFFGYNEPDKVEGYVNHQVRLEQVDTSNLSENAKNLLLEISKKQLEERVSDN